MPTSGDPRQAARQLAALEPGTAAIKHGVRGADGTFLKCSRCPVRDSCETFAEDGDCNLERAYVEERRAAIMGLPHIDPIIDGPAVGLVIWSELRLLRASRYLAAKGEVLPGAEEGFLEYQPVAGKLVAILNAWGRQAERLGLTPATRRALESKGEAGPAAAIAAAIRELAREKPDEVPIDAEFEATDEESDGDE